MSRRRLVERALPVFVMLALAIATLVPLDDRLRLASTEDRAVQSWTDAFAALPDEADVLIGFDPDLGTYAEIRPTVRTLIAELLSRQSRLAVVSLTPEGRMLAVVELARLARADANMARIADLGFVPGAEAALVQLTRRLPEPRVERPIARRLVDEGIGTMDAIVVIGGNDLGPRSWVEQVVPRIDETPVLAVTPTVLLPEVMPYQASGQLDAILATPRDGAAYRPNADLGVYARLAPPDEPSTVALLLGMVIAALALGQALSSRLLRWRGEGSP